MRFLRENRKRMKPISGERGKEIVGEVQEVGNRLRDPGEGREDLGECRPGYLRREFSWPRPWWGWEEAPSFTQTGGKDTIPSCSPVISISTSTIDIRLIKHHGISRRKFHYYIKEMEWRSNNRGKDLIEVNLMLLKKKVLGLITQKILAADYNVSGISQSDPMVKKRYLFKGKLFLPHSACGICCNSSWRSFLLPLAILTVRVTVERPAFT